jgi:iron complex transport system permease protein
VSGDRRTPRSPVVAIGAVSAFALVAALAGLFLGAVPVSPADVLRALLGSGQGVARDIVLLDRLPRVELGLAIGAALSVAGVLFQALLRNPLADPYLVGVGPGALLGASVAGAMGLLGAELAGVSATGVAAFLGAAAAAAAVLLVAGRGGAAAAPRVLLAGVAVGAFATAVATWALYAESENWQNAIRWLLGNLAGADASKVRVAAASVVVLAAVTWWKARDLDALALGEDSARLGGVDATRTVFLLAGVGCLLVAAAVAVAGLVGFVGLVVPHLARRFVGPGHRLLVPVAAGLGAGLLVLSDALARTVSRVEVPVGVVTALLGAPVFAAVLRRTGRQS